MPMTQTGTDTGPVSFVAPTADTPRAPVSGETDQKGRPSTHRLIVAITGATGFLGGHLLDSLTEAGHTVRALTRRPQPERAGVSWVRGDLDNTESLMDLCQGADVLIHGAALTKALTRDIFFDVNVTGSRKVFEAAAAAGIGHVIQVSSLAAREPRLSHYGASKAAAELLLTARKWPFRWVNVRPPAVYGPGDREILKLLQALRYGFLPAPGSRNNRFSMMHARDLADALTLLCHGGNAGQTVEIDDGHTGGYTLADVAAALPAPFGGTGGKRRKPPIILSVPTPLLVTLGLVNGAVARLVRRPVTLTGSSARYLCHADWTVRHALRPRLEGWQPKYTLPQGLAETIEWYRARDLL